MRHEHVREYLSSCVDGSLDDALRATMEDHLRGCAACRAEVEEMRGLFALLANPVLKVDPPGPFHDNVMRRVRLADRERRKSARGLFDRLGWGWAGLGVAATAIVVLVAVLAVGPLLEGRPAGISLWRAAPTATPDTSSRLTMVFPSHPPEPQQPWEITVHINAPHQGVWRLLAAPSPGLTLPGKPDSDADGYHEVWTGLIGPDARATAVLAVTAAPSRLSGQIGLRLLDAQGASAVACVAFLPPSEPDAISSQYSSGNNLYGALMAYSAASRRPVCAPSDMLQLTVPPGVHPITEIAEATGLTAERTGGGFTLSRSSPDAP